MSKDKKDQKKHTPVPAAAAVVPPAEVHVLGAGSEAGMAAHAAGGLDATKVAQDQPAPGATAGDDVAAKADAADEDAKKKDTQRQAEADQAKKEAEEAAATVVKAQQEAKRKATAAALAQAKADDHVLVSVPRAYRLRIGGKMQQIAAGAPSMPRAWAEHQYSKDNGVKIVGIPT